MKQIRNSFIQPEAQSYYQQETSKDSNNPIYFTNLFSREFMRLYTQYDSIEDLLASGGFAINSIEDYEAIPDEAIDAHILETTNFCSWKEMLTEAIKAYTNNE